MRRWLYVIVAVISIAMPLVMPYLMPSIGLHEQAFDQIIYYTFAVCSILLIIGEISKKIIKTRIKRYYFFLYDWRDREKAQEIINLLDQSDISVLPPTLDFFTTDSKEKNKILDKYLRIANCGVVLIGADSVSSDYFISTLKTLKKSGIKIITLMTTPDAPIPDQLQRAQITPILSETDTATLKTTILSLIKQ